MDWFKKHLDTVVVMGGIVSSVMWMNGKFNEMEKENAKRFAAIEKDIAVIKAVLITNRMMSPELALMEEK